MAKKRVPLELFREGARGGSFVQFRESEKDDYIGVKVGHSCVITVDTEIPVTWLAAILTHAKDIGFVNAMGDHRQFPADYALMFNPEVK